jgi:nitrite reductase (NADH) small subunit/3-phenylpropionate/trans-cinnamate dioxygenase ferredoxin subunit
MTGGFGVSQRVVIGKVVDIPVGGSVVVTIGKKEVAVFNVGGQLFALDDTCPHMGASLSGGHVEDGCVTCPWHYWRFRLADGAWADSPRVKTGSYSVHVVGDEVQLELPE